jgi:hypothetical protein
MHLTKLELNSKECLTVGLVVLGEVADFYSEGEGVHSPDMRNN